jgi:hypothetical protein
MKLGIDFSARVPGGPAISSSDTVDVQGLDRIVVDVAQGTPLTVDLQPAATDKLVLLAIRVTPPADDPAAAVTAVVQDGTGAGAKKTDALPLAAPLLLSGASLGLLPGAPKQAVLDYAGAAGKRATVEILIARTV